MICITRVKRFCNQDISQIENYDKAINDRTQTWQCHHRLEELGFTVDQLKYLNLYYGVPADELIFLTIKDHTKLHMIGNQYAKGWKPTDERREQMSKQSTGNKHALGRKWINKNGITKSVKSNELDLFLADGWGLGRFNANWMNCNNTGKYRKWINKDGKTKMVYPIEVENYLSDGWKLGRNKILHNDK